MPGVVYTNYRQSQVITGGRLLRWKNCELIDTMPDNSVVFVSATDIRTVKHRGVDTFAPRSFMISDCLFKERLSDIQGFSPLYQQPA